MNAPEWEYILVGCIASIVMGCSMPAFAVIFGDIIGVSDHFNLMTKLKKNSRFWLILILSMSKIKQMNIVYTSLLLELLQELLLSYK